MQVLTIAGNVGKDAELRQTQGGDPVLNFTVAVDNGKDKSGDRRPSTWFDCSLWGKRGEGLKPYITKGSKIVVTGRPTVRVHEGKAYLGVSVDQVTLMGGGADRQEDRGRDAPPQGRDETSRRDLDDEIPF